MTITSASSRSEKVVVTMFMLEASLISGYFCISLCDIVTTQKLIFDTEKYFLLLVAIASIAKSSAPNDLLYFWTSGPISTC
jgi:hypothetical protein